ncbi:MAG: S8 family serine peptidase, partial [Saprospiraceae bacterium]
MQKIYSATAACLITVLCVVSSTAQQRYPVYFESGVQFLENNFDGRFDALRATPKELFNGRFVRLVQCASVPNATQRALVERAGMQIIDYIPYGAYIASFPEGFDFQVLSAIHARSVSPVLPEWKIARNLREQPHGEWAVRGEFVEITLTVWPHIPIPQAAEHCARAGVKVLAQGRYDGVLTALIHRDEINNTAALPFVKGLELIAPPGQPEDTRGRALHRANMLDVAHPDGLKYTGEGVSVLVRDDGAVGPHIDFQGRMVDLSTSNAANATHGDGVGGIMSGAGNLNPYMRGMAAGSRMFVTNYEAGFQDITLDLHLNEGVSVTNSSYSNGCNAGYTANARTVDRQIFENPGLMHVFSAGNSGTSDCNYGAGANWGNITGGHKVAKNCLAVANLRNNGQLENSSSRGPVHDGRLKPDIAANGFEHNSTGPNNTYQVFGGTSGAAPGVAGCMAQLAQAYKESFNAPYAPSALLKAAMLNTANDLGNAGPDFKFGWGHLNAWRALNLIREGRWQEGAADQNEIKTHTIQVPFGVRQLRVMVYWADPAANASASRALVNDLDLRVVSPSGVVNLPWLLNPTPVPAILDMPAGKGRDSLNNAEQVSILNPQPGAYTIEIAGYEVPLGPQQYYIVWEFDTDAIKITYPSGGEGFVPGQQERIHWDAYGESGNFTLRYSTDGGETFFPIATLTNQPQARMHDWTVPANIISEQVHIMLIRGAQRDTTTLPITIAPVPTELEITRVCPDSLTLQWKAINDTLKYEVYMLGDKYMEIIGKTAAAANQYTLPIQNAGVERWLSVRAANDHGLAGRRANAIRWPGELKNCPQPFDLGLRGVLAPAGSAIIQCEPANQAVSIRVVNEGLTAITDATANYQVNGGAIVSEPLPQINPGDTLNYVFVSEINIADNSDVNLILWIQADGDAVNFNDTLRLRFSVVVQAASGPYTQDFQAPQFPP